MPSISIVVPVLNRVDMIGQALDSVSRQVLGNPPWPVECLVVDGGSTDGTREIVLAHPVAKLIDAPGSSIYEALNRAIKTASGDWIVHLNSDDLLADGALAAFIRATAPEIDVVRGVARYVENAGTGIEHPVADLERRFPATLTIDEILFGSPAINANAVRRSCYDRIGLYDEALRIASDREWLLRALTQGIAIRSISEAVYIYRYHAGSLTIHKRPPSEAAWVDEHLAIAERWLARRDLNRVDRRRLAKFHGKEVAHRLALQVVGRAAGTVPQTLGRAFSVSPAWPAAAIEPVARIAAGRAGRMLGRALGWQGGSRATLVRRKPEDY
jgi:glycosyltransferase involved in cell wall biosynthesis